MVFCIMVAAHHCYLADGSVVHIPNTAIFRMELTK